MDKLRKKIKRKRKVTESSLMYPPDSFPWTKEGEVKKANEEKDKLSHSVDVSFPWITRTTTQNEPENLNSGMYFQNIKRKLIRLIGQNTNARTKAKTITTAIPLGNTYEGDNDHDDDTDDDDNENRDEGVEIPQFYHIDAEIAINEEENDTDDTDDDDENENQDEEGAEIPQFYHFGGEIAVDDTENDDNNNNNNRNTKIDDDVSDAAVISSSIIDTTKKQEVNKYQHFCLSTAMIVLLGCLTIVLPLLLDITFAYLLLRLLSL